MSTSFKPGEHPDPPPVHRHLNLSDPADVAAWLAAVREGVADLAAAARDATARYRRRVLSRPEARRRAREAERALGRLLDAAKGAP